QAEPGAAGDAESPEALPDRERQGVDRCRTPGIVEVVRAKAETGDMVGKRDYALLLFYLITGMRRQEVIGLRGSNLKLEEEALVITGQVKGGDYVGREVREPSLREALLEYLTACGRLAVLKTDGPLWTRHDRAGKPGAALSSHSFVKNLKRY